MKKYIVKGNWSWQKDDVEKDMLRYDEVTSCVKIADFTFQIEARCCTEARWNSFGFRVIQGE